MPVIGLRLRVSATAAVGLAAALLFGVIELRVGGRLEDAGRWNLALSFLRFLGVGLAGILLVHRGRRRTFWVPAALLVGLPAITGGPADGCWPHDGRAVAAIGAGWQGLAPVWACIYRYAAPLRGGIVELVLVLAPATLAALTLRAERRKDASGWSSAAGAGGAVMALAGFLLFWSLSGRYPLWWWLPIFVPPFAFGLLLGAPRRPLEVLGLIGVPALMQPDQWMAAWGTWGLRYEWHVALLLALVGVCLAGALVPRLVRWFAAAARPHPIALPEP